MLKMTVARIRGSGGLYDLARDLGFAISRELFEVFNQFQKVDAPALHPRQRCLFAKRASNRAIFLDIFHGLAGEQRAQPPKVSVLCTRNSEFA